MAEVRPYYPFPPSYISPSSPSLLRYFLGVVMLAFINLECSTFFAISVRVYACDEFGSFDIDSYLRTGLRVSHSDASAEYEDRATSTCM
jgi:hypothetical protein